MKTAYDLTRAQLVEVVDSVQRLLYGRYKVVAGNEIDFFDADKEWSACDLLESIAGVLDNLDLVPSYGSDRAESIGAMLHVCCSCQFAYEESALHPPGPGAAATAVKGRCPRCDDDCRPISAEALVSD
jgi:hypothetical protein